MSIAANLGCLLSLVAEPALPPSPDRPAVVAVFDLEGMDVAPKLLADLSGYLRAKLSERRAFRVIDKGEQEAQLAKLINEERAESYRLCVDESCQIPLGKELAADRILRGKLVRFGRSHVLSVELVDLVTGTTVAAATDKSEGPEEDLLHAVDRVVDAIAKERPLADRPTILEVYGRAGATILGAAFANDPGLEWTALATAGVRWREWSVLWLDVAVGAVVLHQAERVVLAPGSSLRDDLPGFAARFELAEWVRIPLFQGERTSLLPSDRGSIGLGAGGFLLAPGGVGGVLAAQLDLWWLTGRLAATYDTVAKGPGLEISVGLRTDLPL